MLRVFLRFRRSLLSSLCLAEVKALLKYLKLVTSHELMPGIIAVIQTFGTRMNFHPHIHVLISEGGKTRDSFFRRASSFDDELIRELFIREVFSMLLREKMIGLSLVRKILRWRHTGSEPETEISLNASANT